MTGLNLNSASVRDGAGNNAGLAGAVANPNGVLVVDTLAPATTIASAGISADTGASSSDFVTKTAAQAISGTLSANLAAGESVLVSLDNGASWTVASASDGSNSWSLAGQTLTGSSTLLVKVTDTAGNDGTVFSQAYTLDQSAPVTTIASAGFSADTGASNGDFITNTAAQAISGTLSANLAAGESVLVSLDNGASWTVASTSVGSNGWSLAGQTLTGSSTLLVKVTDTAGNDGTVFSQPYTLDQSAPAAGTLSFVDLTDTGTPNDSVTTDKEFLLSLAGGEGGADVIYEVSVDGGNTWSITTANQSSLVDGSYQFRALVSDAAGNSAMTTSIAVKLVTASSGTAVDGYISGATVFADADGDGPRPR